MYLCRFRLNFSYFIKTPFVLHYICVTLYYCSKQTVSITLHVDKLKIYVPKNYFKNKQKSVTYVKVSKQTRFLNYVCDLLDAVNTDIMGYLEAKICEIKEIVRNATFSVTFEFSNNDEQFNVS